MEKIGGRKEQLREEVFMKRFFVVLVAFFVASSLLVSGSAFSQTKEELLEQLNQAKKDYMRAISKINADNRALRRQCDLKKQADYRRSEAEKIELRKTFKYNFLDAHKDERIAYRAKAKAIDDSHRAFVKSLDAKIRAAYIESEKKKKQLRKQLFKTRQEIEAKIKAMTN